MEVVIYDPFVAPEQIEKSGFESVNLDELYQRSDYISIHVPKLKETTGLLNKAAFDKMKDGVMIINCARGGIINEADLEQALTSGKVAGAALDVFAEQAGFVSLPHRSFEAGKRLIHEFATHVVITGVGTHGITTDRHAFDQTMGITFDHGAIHERTGIALVGIADDRLRIALGVGEGVGNDLDLDGCRVLETDRGQRAQNRLAQAEIRERDVGSCGVLGNTTGEHRTHCM